MSAETPSTETSGAAPKIMYTDDITQGLLTADVTHQVTGFAGDGNGMVVGALQSSGPTTQNVYDAKKIPTITPDSRSHAYIKAVEE